MGVTLYLVFLWVPTERSLGVSYRILFFHVPVGWIGMVSILVVAIASVMHLFTGKDKWDSLAYATAELGVIFASLIIVTGSIWAKPTWGVWWTWDPKLTTTLVLWFVYVGYMMVRAYGPIGGQSKRFASVIALIGAIDAPIIYWATVMWRTTHPELNIGPFAESESMDSRMALTLLISAVTFTVLYAYLLMERYSLKRAESDIDGLYQDFS